MLPVVVGVENEGLDVLLDDGVGLVDGGTVGEQFEVGGAPILDGVLAHGEQLAWGRAVVRVRRH